MKLARKLAPFPLLLSLSGAGVSAAYAELKVMTTIKPVHSIVSAVMKGVGEPSLIIDGAQSPHTFSLQPATAKQLQSADLIFWIGPSLETPLVKSINTIAKDAKNVSLMSLEGLSEVHLDEDAHNHDHGHGEAKEHKDHDDHSDHKKHDDHAEHKDHDDHAEHKDHDKHDDHADHKKHSDHDDHKQDAHKHDEHKHDDHKEKAHDDHDDHDDHAKKGEVRDPHIWLDPANAQVMAKSIAENLASSDPENATTYRENAVSFSKQMDGLLASTKQKTSAISKQRFVVFHAAYGHFEKRFGLQAPLAIAHNPEVAPGAKRLREIHHEIEENKAKCVFTEPQFSASFVQAISTDASLKVSSLDPLGQAIDAGPDLYAKLINQLTDSLVDCLS